MKYNPVEIENQLKSLCLYYDTRERENDALRKRLEFIDLPSIRKKLDYADYSGFYTNSEGEQKSLEKIVVIERKFAIDELCNCFTSGRERFKREFERAKEDNCRLYLLVENGSYEKILSHQYRSKLSSQSLIASLLSWSIKYNFQVIFCKPENTGRLIREILHYEMRHYLLNIEE